MFTGIAHSTEGFALPWIVPFECEIVGWTHSLPFAISRDPNVNVDGSVQNYANVVLPSEDRIDENVVLSAVSVQAGVFESQLRQGETVFISSGGQQSVQLFLKRLN